MSINIKKDGKLVKIAPTSYNELTDLPNIESSGDVTYITDEYGKNVATIGPGGLSTTGIVVDRITLDGEDVGTKLDKIKGEIDFNDLTNNPISDNDDGTVSFADESGNKIVLIDSEGVTSVEFKADKHKLTEKADQSYVEDQITRLEASAFSGDYNDLENAPIINDTTGSAIFADEQGNQIAKIDAEGVTSVEFIAGTHKLTNKAEKDALLADFTEDGEHQTVTSAEKTYWSNKSEFSGKFGDLTDSPIIDDNSGELIYTDGTNTIVKIDASGITTTNVAIKEGDVATLIGEKADQTSLDATNDTIAATNATVSTHTTEISNLKTEVANDKTALETFKTETAGNFTAVNKSISDTNDTVDLLGNKVSINEEKLEGVQASDGEFTITDGTNIGMKLDSEGLLHVREVEVAGGRVDERLKDIENYFSTEEDADSNLNKWHEIVDFLNGFEETDQVLENIINTKASKDELNALSTKVDNNNTSINTRIDSVETAYKAADSAIETAYKAADINLQKDINTRALQTSLDATNQKVSTIESTYATKAEIAEKVETDLLVTDAITLNESEFIFADEAGNKIAEINNTGVNSVDFIAGTHKLTEKANKSDVENQITSTNTSIETVAAAIRKEFAAEDTKLSTKISEIDAAYKAEDTKIKEDVNKRALQTALDSTNQEVSNIKNNYVTKAEIAAEVKTEHLEADNITLNQDSYIFTDGTNKIAEIDSTGVSSTEFTAGSHQLTKKADMSYVGDQITSINSSITTTAAAIRKEFADVDSELSNRIDTINAEYQAADDTLQSAIDKKADQTAVDAANSRIDTIANTYATKEEIATEVDTEHLVTDRVTLNDDTFIFADNKGDGHKIAEINSEGVISVDFIAGTEGEHKLTLKADTSYVNDQITALDATITNTASTIRKEFAAKDTELSNKITTVETNYKSADEDIKLAYAAADKTVENKITALENSIGTSISTGNITATGTIKANKIITDDFELKQDSYQFADSNGNKIAEISSNGLSTTKVQIAEGDVATLLGGKVDDETFNNSISNLETNKVSNSALTETLKSYALKGEIPKLDGYLKETVADRKYATIATTNNLQNSINSVNTNLSTRLGTAEGNITSVGNRVSTLEGYFATAEDPDDIINKWTDVVEFLDGMAEGNTDGEKLDAILAAKANQASLDATNNRIDTIEDDYVTKVELASEVDTEHLIADNITARQPEFIFFADPNGYKVAEIDESGITAVDFIAKDGDKLTNKADKSSVDALDSKIDNLTTSDVSEGTNKYFTNARVKSAITGSASTIVDTDLTASRVLITNGSKKVAVSSITSTKLGYLTDVTGNIQAQLNGKVATATVTALDTRVGTIEGYFTGGAAKKVSKSLIVKVSGTQMHSYNGSAEKIVNFKAGNNISLTFEGNDITITGTAQSTDISGLESEISALKTGKQDVITNLSTITNNAANGATAYGWGNHAKAGYLTKTTADGYYAPKSLSDTVNGLDLTKVKSTTTTSTYYLCGSTTANTATGTLVKRSNVYVNGSGSIYGKSFFETSDETLKNFSNNVEVDFEKLLKLPKKYFTWKDGDDTQHIGTSAQEVQKIYPELVSEGSEGKLTVDYAKLSIVALKAIDELYIKNLELEERLSKIETLLNIK